MTALFLVTALIVLLFIGVPVAVSLGLSSILTMLFFGDQTLLSSSQKFFHTMQVYPLLAVPFFILAGTFLTTGGVAKRMVAFANALVGHFRGGLAMAALLASAFFAAVSGSAPATVVAVGSVPWLWMRGGAASLPSQQVAYPAAYVGLPLSGRQCYPHQEEESEHHRRQCCF